MAYPHMTPAPCSFDHAFSKRSAKLRESAKIIQFPKASVRLCDECEPPAARVALGLLGVTGLGLFDYD